jgi:hypothetical protein
MSRGLLNMNVQQHERIAQIKKISGYLCVVLTWISYSLWVFCPLLAIAILADTSGESRYTFLLGGVTVENVDLSYPQRILIVILMAVFFFFLIKLTTHFRELIRYFSKGEIFNKDAIGHARKSLLHGLVVFGFYLSTLLAGFVYTATKTSSVHISLNIGVVTGCIFFGLMYVLLWSLEIGADLNEESELTI